MMQSISRLASRPAALTSLALAMAAAFAHTQARADDAFADTIVVTATRTPQKLADTISDTVTIKPEQIAEAGSGSIVDLLKRQRGIEVVRNGGAGSSANVYIRGANSNQSIVLVDGVRIGSSTTGAANWSAIPLTAIDHIEIVYGPLSSLYGADAIGGVIQIFTKKGQGAPAVSAFAGYGSDHTREADATVSGATGGEHSFGYSVSAGKEKSDGFSTTRGGLSFNPDDDGYDKENVSGQFSLQLAKGYEAGALFLHSKLDSRYDNKLDAYDVRSQNVIDTASVYAKAQLLPVWDSLLQYSQTKDKGENYAGATASDHSLIRTKQSFITWQNDVRIGADVLQLLYEHRKEEVRTNGFNLRNPERTTNSFAASYNARRGDNLLSAAVRRDNTIYGSQNTGSLGYGYNVTRALRATASYGTSFRAPTYNELYFPNYGNTAINPEKGRNAEIGLRYDDGVNALSAGYYRNRLTDMIINLNPCPSRLVVTNSGCAYNVNRATLEGLTLSAATRIAGVDLAANLDLQDPKDETTGRRLLRRSKKHGNVNAGYTIGALKAGAELELSGDRFENAANSRRLGGYGLVNLYATYRFSRDWSALVRWNNIGDKRYELAEYYNTPGSQVFAGIRYGYK